MFTFFDLGVPTLVFFLINGKPLKSPSECCYGEIKTQVQMEIDLKYSIFPHPQLSPLLSIPLPCFVFLYGM